jgi:hypothetical protein
MDMCGGDVVVKGKGWFRKKPMDLCVYENEDREDGVGAGVNTTPDVGISDEKLFIIKSS